MYSRKIQDSLRVALFLLSLCIFYTSCQKKPEEPIEKILVKIDNKTISLNEFIRRAEYTIRPPYCHGSSNLDKKVIINSLIAEKMLSIEATDTNSFITDDRVQRYIRGIKEQTMRQWLYEREIGDQVSADEEKLKTMYKHAGHKYQVAHFSLSDSSTAEKIKQELTKDPAAFDEISNQLTGLDSLFRREVAWAPSENDMVLDSLFSRPLKKNEVVGPIKINSEQYMFIKIQGAIISPAITALQQKERWQNVEEELTEREAIKQYHKFVTKVMKGKKLEFDGDTFFQMVDLLEPVYVIEDQAKQERFSNLFGEKREEELEKFKDLESRMREFYQNTLFKINDEIWTVEDYANELMSHPLVFRTKKLTKENFPQQLKFAIVDMVRDKYLTQVAYKRGYDQVNVVKRNTNIWRDHLNYQYYRSKLLADAMPDNEEELSYFQIIEKYLNAPVDSLQEKYSDVIEVDVDAFNDIKLTRIDLQAYYQNAAYPQIVPAFPMVTTDNKLNYGKKMVSEKQ